MESEQYNESLIDSQCTEEEYEQANFVNINRGNRKDSFQQDLDLIGEDLETY